MTTVDLEQQRLLIGGEWVEASGGGTFERTDPFTGEAVTVAAAAGREDARRAVEAARDAFPEWSGDVAGRAPQAAQPRRGPADGGRARHRGDDDRGGRRDVRVGDVQLRPGVADAARGGRPDLLGGRRGHPLRRPGLARDGRPPARRRRGRHVAVERAGDPRHARDRDAAGLRQHGRAEGVRAVPAHARGDRPRARRRRAARRRGQPDHPLRRGRARRGRRADRPSGRPAGELHRLLEGRQDHRDQVRRELQALPARARRQGAAGRAGRRRPRRRRRCGELRRVHELGADLHVDRADRRRPRRRRRARREAGRARGQARDRRPARPGHDDRPGRQRRRARAHHGADRGRPRPRAPRCSPAATPTAT